MWCEDAQMHKIEPWFCRIFQNSGALSVDILKHSEKMNNIGISILIYIFHIGYFPIVPGSESLHVSSGSYSSSNIIKYAMTRSRKL